MRDSRKPQQFFHIGKPALVSRIFEDGGTELEFCADHLEECMKAFLFGFGMGIGLGVLFAPMSGEQTRRNLADRANDLADTARETSDQIRDRVRSGMSAIRGGGTATGTEGAGGQQF